MDDDLRLLSDHMRSEALALADSGRFEEAFLHLDAIVAHERECALHDRLLELLDAGAADDDLELIMLGWELDAAIAATSAILDELSGLD